MPYKNHSFTLLAFLGMWNNYYFIFYISKYFFKMEEPFFFMNLQIFL